MKKIYIVIMLATFAIMANQKQVNHVKQVSQSEYAVSIKDWTFPSLWRDNESIIGTESDLLPPIDYMA